MSRSTDEYYWPPGPSRCEVEEALGVHSRVLRDVYSAELSTAISAETRFLLASLGQLVVQQQVGLFQDYPGALARYQGGGT